MCVYSVESTTLLSIKCLHTEITFGLLVWSYMRKVCKDARRRSWTSCVTTLKTESAWKAAFAIGLAGASTIVQVEHMRNHYHTLWRIGSFDDVLCGKERSLLVFWITYLFTFAMSIILILQASWTLGVMENFF